MVHGLQDDFNASVGFVFLDIDDPANDDLKAALGYRHQPHYFLLEPDGSIRQAWQGRVKEDDLRAALTELAGG